jgi:hypothetical protein
MPHIQPPQPDGIPAYRDPIDRRAVPSRTSQALQLFKKFEVKADGPVAKRDDRVWTGDLDLSCVSVWNDHDGPRGAGTLIHRRAALLAHHLPYYKGNRAWFVSQKESRVVMGVVAESVPVPGTDIQVVYFEREIDDSIKPAKLLHPSAVADPNAYIGTPILNTDQFGQVLTADIAQFDATCWIRKAPASSPRARFFKPAQVWISGHPFLLVRDDYIVMVSHFTYNTHGISYYTAHKKIMDTLSSLGPEKPELVNEMPR